MSLTTERRESVCRTCPSGQYVESWGRGCCKKMRLDNGKVSPEKLAEAIERGTCPEQHWLHLATEGK